MSTIESWWIPISMFPTFFFVVIVAWFEAVDNKNSTKNLCWYLWFFEKIYFSIETHLQITNGQIFLWQTNNCDLNFKKPLDCVICEFFFFFFYDLIKIWNCIDLWWIDVQADFKWTTRTHLQHLISMEVNFVWNYIINYWW